MNSGSSTFIEQEIASILVAIAYVQELQFTRQTITSRTMSLPSRSPAGAQQSSSSSRPKTDYRALIEELATEVDKLRKKYTNLPTKQTKEERQKLGRREQLRALKKEVGRIGEALDALDTAGGDDPTSRSPGGRTRTGGRRAGTPAPDDDEDDIDHNSTAWVDHVAASAFENRYQHAFSPNSRIGSPSRNKKSGSPSTTARGGAPRGLSTTSYHNKMPAMSRTTPKQFLDKSYNNRSSSASASQPYPVQQPSTNINSGLSNVLSISRQTQQLQQQIAAQQNEIDRMKNDITPHFRDLVQRDELYLKKLTASQKSLHEKLENLMQLKQPSTGFSLEEHYERRKELESLGGSFGSSSVGGGPGESYFYGQGGRGGGGWSSSSPDYTVRGDPGLRGKNKPVWLQ
ncbi:unnamed protein product [Amoebophrya sp. A120]|nr:unnamed protein product [Amoebophrya sp. A120]|eukprot:GSA120T00006870001.1